jgi:hypothetical protein
MQESMPLTMLGKEDTPYNHRADSRPNDKPTTMPGLNAESLECHFSWTDDKEMLDCFQFSTSPSRGCYLNIPEDAAIDNPLDMEAIKEQQEAD